MVFSSATIPTGELNALGRNKPILGGKNAFKSYNQVPQWSSSGDWSDSGVGGGSNKTNTLVPPSYLYDDFTHITTYPSSVIGFNTVYILFDLKEDIDIDSMLVLNHNFGTIAAGLSTTISIQLQVSNSPTFSSPTTILSQTTISTNNRLWLLAGASLRFSTVRYARIMIWTAGPNFTGTFYPRIGEIWVGRRYHLSRNPEIPWNPDNIIAKRQIATSLSGVYVANADFYGQHILTPTWMPTAGDVHTELNDRQTLLDWYESIEYGSFCFPFIIDYNLGTEKRLFMCVRSTDLDMPYQGPRHSSLTLELAEQRGFLVLE